jgi:HEAT repeats
LALRRIGPDAVAPVLEVWSKNESIHRPGVIPFRQTIADILGRMGPAAGEAIPALTQALSDPAVQVRIQAALALWQIDHPAEKVIAPLLDGLRDNDGSVRRRCSAVLAQMEPLPLEVVTGLQAALKDPDRVVRINAAEALCGVPGQSHAAILVLATAFTQYDPAPPGRRGAGQGRTECERIQAALALWRITGQAKDTLPVLIGELRSCRGRRQASASSSPARSGTVLSRLTPPPCQQAAEALGQMGPAARAAVPELTKVLGDLRLAAYRPYFAVALLKIEPRAADAAMPVLMDALDDADAGVRREAAKTLGAIGGEIHDVVPHLKKDQAVLAVDFPATRDAAGNQSGGTDCRTAPTLAAARRRSRPSDCRDLARPLL